jgi:hypothetical protein
MRNAVLAVVIGLVCIVGTASATIPDPDLCTVSPCDDFLGLVVYPDPNPGGSAEFTANIRNGDDEPIPNAYVEVVFLAPETHTFCVDVVLDGNTDEFGNITFNISAGGCSDDVVPVVNIIANGTLIREYNTAKGGDWAPTSDGIVELADFIYFGNNYGPNPGCTDYFNDDITGLDDFIAFGEHWGHACP